MISSMKQPRSTDPNLSLIGTSQRCSGCGTVNTPLWRLGPSGPKSMCNACGIRWKRNSSNPKKKRALLNAKPTDDEDDYITPPPTPERERRRGSLSIEAPGSSPLQHGRVYDERTTTSFYVREVDLNALHSSDGSEVFNSSELSDDEISMIDEDDDFEQEEEEYEERPRKGSPHVSMKRRPEPKKPLKNKKPVAPAAASQPKQELTTPKFDRIDALAIVATSDFKIMEFQAAYNGLLQREAAQSTTIRDLVEQLNEKDRRIRHLERLLCSAPSAVSSFHQSSRSSQISVQSLLSHMN